MSACTGPSKKKFFQEPPKIYWHNKNNWIGSERNSTTVDLMKLKMKCPADLYKPSLRRYPDWLTELHYADHDLVRVVHSTGTVHFRALNKFFISQALAGQTIGFKKEQA